MKTYFSKNAKSFNETVDLIENENIKNTTIYIENDINHCHRLRFLVDKDIAITGINKPKYSIYIDPKEISSNPNWKFNTTLFFYSNNADISFSNLHFIYLIEKYDFVDIIDHYDKKTKKNIEIIDFKNVHIFNSFGIVLMEFYNSKINFEDCIFENNTNRTFEIIIKNQSTIIFENCHFNGDFIFITDIKSKIVIQ